VNRDFAEMLSALSAADVDFIIVGAHALAAHGVPRATGDIDIWVRPTGLNAERVLRALAAFGAPLFDLTMEDLEDFIVNKKASGRAKDLLDLELLLEQE